MLRLWHAEKRAGARLQPATLARVKGQVYGEHPQLLSRVVQLSQKKQLENRDPTFRGTHPMFQRLARSGWYGRRGAIAELQGLADNLRQTRRLAPGQPLASVEILAFDLEATGNRGIGRFDGKRGRFLSGWDEVTQFGYTIYRGGRKVRSGTIDVNPTVGIDPRAQEITGLTPQTQAGAPRFERAARQILELMQGRVLVGQSAVSRDWAWLQSNFSRLGVNLPGPRGLILDTHLLSFNRSPGGSGLAGLARELGVRQRNHHSARYDAETAGDVFFAMMRASGARTLGQAFELQQRGDQIRHLPR